MDVLAPILNLVEHDVDGAPRWTGWAYAEGVISLNVLVLRFRGDLIAVRNRCPHRDVPLLLGRVDEDEGFLECPSHGWQLKLRGDDLRGRAVVERDGQFFVVIAGR